MFGKQAVFLLERYLNFLPCCQFPVLEGIDLHDGLGAHSVFLGNVFNVFIPFHGVNLSFPAFLFCLSGFLPGRWLLNYGRPVLLAGNRLLLHLFLLQLLLLHRPDTDWLLFLRIRSFFLFGNGRNNQYGVFLQTIFLYCRIVFVDILRGYLICFADGIQSLPFTHDVRVADDSVHSHFFL